jgi:hypothetical protein
MAAPVFNSVGQRLYDALGPLRFKDAELDYPLGHYCNAIGVMLSPLNDLVREEHHEDGDHPGWAHALDVDAAPIFVLPWLAQFVGVILEPFLNDGTEDIEVWADRQRQRIKTHEAYDRGTVGHLVRGAQEWLTGTKTVYLYERDTNAWHMTIVTLIKETPDATAMLENLRREHKAAGLILDHAMVEGWTYAMIDSEYSTYTAIDADFATYTRLQEGPI